MKKMYLVLSWLLLASSTVLLATYTAQTVISPTKQPIVIATPWQAEIASSETSYQATVGEVKGIETTIEGEDARADLVANFLKRHDSPMKPHDEYGKKLVEIADKYNIDFRLLPAIAMQESNLCKKIPEGSYNCLGFGIHERGTLMFDSYEAAFERAAREIKKNYIDQGRSTPEEIMKKYTPSSNGSWASSVNQWMAEMRYDDRSKGKELKTNANVWEFVKEDEKKPQE